MSTAIRSSSAIKRRPTLAVWKFASCDGCQLSLLDCEEELLAVADAIDIAWFPEASSTMREGPYDLSLVEGSISAPEHIELIKKIRAQSRKLVTIGACATSGGIQALRNFANADEYAAYVYPSPQFLSSLATSTAIADHVKVDFELRGCPINKLQ
jgi:sulfhydrogenase subunit delta